MKAHTICPCCGNKVTAYTHCLNSSLAKAFVAMTEAYITNKRPINVNTELGLTHNQIANFQKLRYFGLAVNIEGRGWVPTLTGQQFFYNEVKILTPAGSMGNKPLLDDDPAWATHKKPRKMISLADVLGGTWAYKRRPEYQAEKSDQFALPLANQNDKLFM